PHADRRKDGRKHTDNRNEHGLIQWILRRRMVDGLDDRACATLPERLQFRRHAFRQRKASTTIMRPEQLNSPWSNADAVEYNPLVSDITHDALQTRGCSPTRHVELAKSRM